MPAIIALEVRVYLMNSIDWYDSGCYERSPNKNYMFEKIQTPGSDDRPDTFYFGDFGDDVDRCEAACKDEPDCVAYTLFKVGSMLRHRDYVTSYL